MDTTPTAELRTRFLNAFRQSKYSQIYRYARAEGLGETEPIQRPGFADPLTVRDCQDEFELTLQLLSNAPEPVTVLAGEDIPVPAWQDDETLFIMRFDDIQLDILGNDWEDYLLDYEPIYVVLSDDGNTIPRMRFHHVIDVFGEPRVYEVRHPHISRAPCFGNYEPTIAQAAHNGGLYLLMQTLRQFLETWNPNSPFHDHWQENEEVTVHYQLDDWRPKTTERTTNGYAHFALHERLFLMEMGWDTPEEQVWIGKCMQKVGCNLYEATELLNQFWHAIEHQITPPEPTEDQEAHADVLRQLIEQCNFYRDGQLPQERVDRLTSAEAGVPADLLRRTLATRLSQDHRRTVTELRDQLLEMYREVSPVYSGSNIRAAFERGDGGVTAILERSIERGEFNRYRHLHIDWAAAQAYFDHQQDTLSDPEPLLREAENQLEIIYWHVLQSARTKVHHILRSIENEMSTVQGYGVQSDLFTPAIPDNGMEWSGVVQDDDGRQRVSDAV